MADFEKQPLEWLIIFLVYNNTYYDVESQENKDNPPGENKPKDYSSMEQQTKYILEQIRYTHYSQKVKTVFVEVEIKPDRLGNTFATLSMLRKKRGAWLSSVDGIWRIGKPLEILTEPESVEEILMRLKKIYPANKHMIVTAGHGSIIGINYYIPKLKQRVDEKGKAFIEQKLHENPLVDNGSLKQPISKADPYLLFLANQEISEVLKAVFQEKKVDVLVMYNCLMQNIFTQFDLRETVDWLVAPLSGISIPGFNYGNILNEISVNPAINGEMVSELLINSIRAGNQYSLFKSDIEGTWKIAAIQLNKEKYELIQLRFHELFRAINESRNEFGREVTNCIKSTLRFLFNYGHYCLKAIHISDLGVFLEYFKDNINTNYKNLSNLLAPIASLQAALTENNKQYLFQGKDFYNNGTSHKEDEVRFKEHIANIAIMFPFKKFSSKGLLEIMCDPDKYREREAPDNKYKIPAFFQNENYAELINKIMKPY